MLIHHRRTRSTPVTSFSRDLLAIRRTLKDLARKGEITRSMEQMLSDWGRSLESDAENIQDFTLECQYQVLGWILDLSAAVKILDGGPRTPNTRVRKLIVECVRRILGYNAKVDLIVVPSNLKWKTLWCKAQHDPKTGEIAFILFLSPVIDYTQPKLLPRIVHEAGHADSHALELVGRGSSQDRWLGEASCDLIALLLSGPANLFSISEMVTAVGVELAKHSTYSHPSLILRTAIMREIAVEIWRATKIEGLVKEALGPIENIDVPVGERDERSSLSRGLIDSLPGYRRIDIGTEIWEGVYRGGVSASRGYPMLVSLNAFFAASRKGGGG